MTKKHINLALQGGGAHGAYTWGVLDRLLEDEDIEIDGISATSAGALNGAALKAGMIEGGRQGARDRLDWLWQQVGASDSADFGAWFNLHGLGPVAQAIEYSPAFAWVAAMSQFTSPYNLGPFYENPLRRIVERFDFGKVCSHHGPALYVCATNVRSGKIRVFSGDEISADSLMASACLPTMFRAVEIADPATGQTEAYWDGGYCGNPALFPLFIPELPADVVIVNINPLYRQDLPTTPNQIQNRINEISFNSSLLRELRAIAFVQRLLDEGRLAKGQMARVLVHMIADDDLMNQLSVATKLMPNAFVLGRLKAAGRQSAEDFLARHKRDLNVRGTVDLAATYS